MTGKRVTCTGCSLLCDDIIVRTNGLYIDEIFGACLKGKERFDLITSKNRILFPMIRNNGELEKASLKKAIKKAAEIITNSSKPLLYGFSTVSCQAQIQGLELARCIDGFIDSNSIICQGKVMNTAKQTGLTLTTISEVINKTDLLIFWGANVAESIPRLLNKVLFSRGKFRMTGREIRTLVIIDPVKTASFNVMGVRDIALRVAPGRDIELIRILKEECCSPDSIPSKGVAGIDKNDLKRLLIQLTNSENGVIFIGQGIVGSSGNTETLQELLELVQMINAKQQKGRISVMMLGGHYNMTGFEHIALSTYGKNHSLQFSGGVVVETSESIISKIAKTDFDCSIIVGTDPISHLPWKLSKQLVSKPIILIENKRSATFNVADVIIPSAVTGIECGGLAYRLDHVPLEVHQIVNPPNDVISDEEILSQLIKEVE